MMLYAHAECVMSVRVQVVMDEVERERLRRAAEKEGVSLSDWLRRAARDRLRASEGPGLDTVEDLEEFFAECERREQGTEPSWEEHLRVVDESRASGRTAT
jgi:hypothetical protein